MTREQLNGQWDLPTVHGKEDWYNLWTISRRVIQAPELCCEREKDEEEPCSSLHCNNADLDLTGR